MARIARLLRGNGIDIDRAVATVQGAGGNSKLLIAVVGKAGSGKTHLLAHLVERLRAAGLKQVTGDIERKRARSDRSFAVIAPTNKAASVLRHRGVVGATTIHRIIYTPLYDPTWEALAEWLAEPLIRERPKIEGYSDAQLDKALEFYQRTASVPGALAIIGLRGSNFLSGWKRREDVLDIGLVDEASMLDEKALADLQAIFDTLILFGDPAQLAPIYADSGAREGAMAFERVGDDRRFILNRIHRQTADNPILDLAHALADPTLSFADFEAMIRQRAARDDRVTWAERMDPDVMARSPALVWRNQTRIRLINAFRGAHGLKEDELHPGEPLFCDGVELPQKHRNKRLDLEAAGLIKGAQVIYRGPGRKPGFARLHVVGAADPDISAATIIQIEKPDQEQPFMATAARMGAAFVHGASCTIHKAQGSQWPVVQVFAPDIYAASQSGRVENGIPLWKRLAYVAITRAEDQLRWVIRPMMARPQRPLGIADLRVDATLDALAESR